MFTLADLPYAGDALEPHLSAQALALHYDKHHRFYVDKLNELLETADTGGSTLEEVMRRSHARPARTAIFNNAAQCWNHDFFWHSMKPEGGGPPTGEIKNRIKRDIGTVAIFNEAFVNAAAKHFGSGWLWLTLAGGKLEIMTTQDADLPRTHGRTALLACDLWEHAYYLDYHNRRAEFVQVFLDHLIDWDFVNSNLAAAS